MYLQLTLEWKDVLKEYYTLLEAPKENVMLVISDGIRQLADQLIDRTQRFRNAKEVRSFLKNRPSSDGKCLCYCFINFTLVQRFCSQFTSLQNYLLSYISTNAPVLLDMCSATRHVHKLNTDYLSKLSSCHTAKVQYMNTYINT